MARGNIKRWMVNQTTRHSSDIVQISPAGVLGRPLVVLVNYREAQDILQRRGADFDVASLHNEIFRGIMPGAAITNYTDEQYNSIRVLTRELMTASFLSNVSGPKLYAEASRFTNTWKAKSQRALGRPWNASPDFERLALNVGFSVVFGARQQGDDEAISGSLSGEPLHDDASEAVDCDEPIAFEEAPLPDIFAASRLHSQALLDAALGAPRLYYFALGFLASWRTSLDLVNTYVGKRAAAFTQELARGANPCPTSHLEAALSKDARQHRRARAKTVQDEAYSHLLGIHDTIPHFMDWAAVYLGIHQHLQRQLRAGLRAAYPQAAAEQQVLRCRPPVSFLLREARRDTTILGHSIPKGAQPSSPPAGWEKPEVFDPGRWLRNDPETGEAKFNGQSGPFLAFGAGRRGCFGKRLAYLNLRVVLTLLVWSFEFGELPDNIMTDLGLEQHKSAKPRAAWVRLRQVCC
ncbi:cytochrome p450 [Hirsutella rhossiliensis]|uniref:Cytochrome p450 domain-containing protein n=1 Tax=Hirsutella rhossiliensis TaxID=111463 RepID=A0A9P8SHQ8_9HYPO|nr:cytochrome p450 domain-containing protein [Hirsutella rhossiliensis]KAH0963393.1 cytochrome p450 domain-containing protein [Hirsutella rhossiliensis]